MRPPVLRSSLLSVLFFFLLFGSSWAQVDVGIYFDEAGTVSDWQTSAAYEAVSGWVVLRNEGAEFPIHGYEFKIGAVGIPESYLVSTEVIHSGINVGDQYSLQVDLVEQVALGDSLAIVRFQVLVPEPAQEIQLFVEPFVLSTGTSHDPEGTGYPVRRPLLFLADYTVQALDFASGCQHLPAAIINDDGQESAPILSGFPDDLYFEVAEPGQEQEISFTVTNDGTVPVGGILAPGGVGYTVRQGSGPDVTVPHHLFLPAGDSQTLTLTYGPDELGDHAGSLDLDACGLVTWNSALTGHCGDASCTIAPSGLDFGSLQVGQADTLDVLITNGSGFEMTLSPAIAGQGFTWFVDAGEDPYLLATGTSRNFHLVFAPTQAAAHDAVLSFGPQACSDVALSGVAVLPPPTCEMVPTTIDFGTSLVGVTVYRQLRISNVGGGVLNGTLDQSATPTEFRVLGLTRSYSLEAGESVTFTLHFTPQAEGELTGAMDAGSDCGPVQLIGAGTLVPPPACQVLPGDLDFGDVLLGQSSDRQLRVTNTGGEILTGALDLSGVPAEFSLLEASPDYAVAGGDTAVFTLRFTPLAEGVQSGVLDSGAGCGMQNLTGTGTVPPPPVCEVSATGLNFGSVLAGQTSFHTLRISNSGGSLLSGELDLSGLPPEFEMTTPDTNYALAGGESKDFTFAFAPTGEGSYDGQLDTGGDCASVSFTGIGTIPVCEVLPGNLDFGTVLVGLAAELDLRITNTGAGTLAGGLDLTGAPAEFELLDEDPAFAVTSGDTALFTLRFTPSAAGGFAGQLDLGTACGLLDLAGVGEMPPPAELTLVQPDGGENWTFGAIESVHWTTTSLVPYRLNLDISLDGGATWRREFTEVVFEGNDLTGSMRAPGPPSTDCLLRLETPDGSMSATSAAPFTIVEGPGYQVLTPNGGEIYALGSEVTVEWRGDPGLGEVMVEYANEHIEGWQPIAAAPAGDGTCVWTVATLPGSQFQIRVRNQPAEGGDLYYDRSNQHFTVESAPYLELTSPAAGDTLFNGRLCDLAWTGYEVDTVDLQARPVSGGSWQTLIAGTMNDGAESWQATFAATDQYELRLAETAGATVSRVVGPVTVLSRQLTVSEPVAGAEFQLDAELNVVWTGTGIDGVAIDLSRDDGSSWTELVSAAPCSGSATVTPGGPASTDCRVRVRVTDPGAAVLEALNPGTFTLHHGITVEHPGSHTACVPGQELQLVWSDTGISNIRIELSRDHEQTWTVLEGSLANAGTYAWTATAPAALAASFRISDADGSAVAVSESFVIYRPDALTATPANIDFGFCEYDGGGWIAAPAELIISNTSPDSAAVLIYNFLPDVEIISDPPLGVPFTLGPGGSQTLQLQGTAFMPGSVTGALAFWPGAAAGENRYDLQVPLAAYGMAPPSVSFEPSYTQFGEVQIGESRSQVVTITPSIDQYTTLEGEIPQTHSQSPFRVVSGLGPFSLTQGQTLEVEIVFEPTSEGWFNGGLGLNLNYDVYADDHIEMEGVCPMVMTSSSAGVAAIDTMVFGNLGTQQQEGFVELVPPGKSTVSCETFSIIEGGGPYTLDPGGELRVVVQYVPDDTESDVCGVSNGQSVCPLVGNSSASAVGDEGVPLPLALQLASPNPFNIRTVIHMTAPGDDEPVFVDIYDARGRHVRQLWDRPLPAGRSEIIWEGRDTRGQIVPSGIYLVAMKSREQEQKLKVLLLK